MSIYDIPAIVASCLPRAATPSNVIAGLKATGIYPFDWNIFTVSDFAPGFITDRPLFVEEHVDALKTLHTVESPPQTRSQCIQTSEKPNSSSVNKSPHLASESPTSSNEHLVSESQSPGPR